MMNLGKKVMTTGMAVTQFILKMVCTALLHFTLILRGLTGLPPPAPCASPQWLGLACLSWINFLG